MSGLLGELAGLIIPLDPITPDMSPRRKAWINLRWWFAEWLDPTPDTDDADCDERWRP